MVKFLPLTVSCPNCGSQDITYTCEPNCCFNHLCGNCYTAFELGTNLVGEETGKVEPPSGERDTCAPTVACARCESLEVFAANRTDGVAGKLICTSCLALLQLEFISE